MSQVSEINQAISLGREDMARFFKSLVDLAPYAHETDVGAAGYAAFSGQQAKLHDLISSKLYLAVSKGDIVLDLGYVHGHIMEENKEVLAGMDEDDVRLVGLFAQAVGRLSQVKEYLIATDRVLETQENRDTQLYKSLETIRQILLVVQRTSVRFMTGPGGAMALSKMDGNSPFDVDLHGPAAAAY